MKLRYIRDGQIMHDMNTERGKTMFCSVNEAKKYSTSITKIYGVGSVSSNPMMLLLSGRT